MTAISSITVRLSSVVAHAGPNGSSKSQAVIASPAYT